MGGGGLAGPALGAEETAGNGAGRGRAERCGAALETEGGPAGCRNAPTVGCGRHGCGGRPCCAGCRPSAVLRGSCRGVRGRLSFRQSAVLCLGPRRHLVKEVVLASNSRCSLSETSGEKKLFFIYTAIAIKTKKPLENILWLVFTLLIYDVGCSFSKQQ